VVFITTDFRFQTSVSSRFSWRYIKQQSLILLTKDLAGRRLNAWALTNHIVIIIIIVVFQLRPYLSCGH